MEELKKQLQQTFPSWQAFVKAQDPKQLIVNYDSIRRLSDVYESTPVTLALLTDCYPLKETFAGLDYLSRWLTFLNDFLNINKGIPTQFLGQLAYTLYAKYNHFRLSDLKLLFDFILESRYGTFYGSIDTQRIVSSFFEYNRERNDVFRRIEEEEARRKKEEARKIELTEEEMERSREIREAIFKRWNSERDMYS